LRNPSAGVRKARASGSTGKAWAPEAHARAAQAAAKRKYSVFDGRVMSIREARTKRIDAEFLPPRRHFYRII
jgi:hypothetical protein